MQVRIAPDISSAIANMQKKNGLYPRFEGRSAAQITETLLRESDTLKQVQKNMAAEANPRPGAKAR